MKNIKQKHLLFQIFYFTLTLYLTIQLSGCSTSQNNQAAGNNTTNQEEWIQLFNGQDIHNWTPKFVNQELGVNYKNTFRVERQFTQSAL